MEKEELKLPENIKYLAVEGGIGAGKTTLCHMLAEQFNGKLVLEDVDNNPFLGNFYENRSSAAFQVQLWFLLSRYKQLTEDFIQQDLFYDLTISDYIYAKDAIFAGINLDENELSMYYTVVKSMAEKIPTPDFVIYLQTSTEVLLKRIEKRGRTFEKNMDIRYIETLNEAYNHYFFHYKESPILIINTDDIDFVKNEEDFVEIIRYVNRSSWGSNYYKPMTLESRRRLVKNDSSS